MDKRTNIQAEIDEVEERIDAVEITLEDLGEEQPAGFRRLYLAGLGGALLVGDRVGGMVDSLIGPTMDRLVERGLALEEEQLRQWTDPAQESLKTTIDAASDASRQATQSATKTATTVAGETRKQFLVASSSMLTALSTQIDALRESVEELRKTLPETPENNNDVA